MPTPRLCDYPTGKSVRVPIMPCQAHFAKIFCFSEDPNQMHIYLVPSLLQGRLAIVTNAGRDAVDAKAAR
jgi:hypothetical protein